MLWNWNTIDACFISSSWQITSDGHFAGSCIGVVLLVMTLEGLRRAVKEYDHYLLRQHAAKQVGYQPKPENPSKLKADDKVAATCGNHVVAGEAAAARVVAFRPNVLQQAIRAFLHMAQFALAYFIMLLAMYYNGYLLICIFIGAYLGAFVFHWEPLSARSPTSATEEATVCCG
jgi:solute carrier family 31 (copper transporter), member 1